MIPRNGSSLGRAGGRLRRYPGGTENASIFATVRGSMPNRRAASRRLVPSTYTARRTCPYSSTRFISSTSAAPWQMGYCCRIFTPAQPVYPAASVRDFLSGAYRRYADLAKLFTNAWRNIKFAVAKQYFMIATEFGADFDSIFHRMTCEYPRD